MLTAPRFFPISMGEKNLHLVAALGDFDEPQRSTMTMFGVLTIAVRIYQDRWGYGIYSGPIGSAVFIITVKWVSGRWQSVFTIFLCFSPSTLISSLVFSTSLHDLHVKYLYPCVIPMHFFFFSVLCTLFVPFLPLPLHFVLFSFV